MENVHQIIKKINFYFFGLKIRKLRILPVMEYVSWRIFLMHFLINVNSFLMIFNSRISDLFYMVHIIPYHLWTISNGPWIVKMNEHIEYVIVYDFQSSSIWYLNEDDFYLDDSCRRNCLSGYFIINCVVNDCCTDEV